jgi:hypothetical protein
VTLINILVKVFHSRDGAANLNIDVALVPHGQVGVVRDDPTVVKDKARAGCYPTQWAGLDNSIVQDGVKTEEKNQKI